MENNLIYIVTAAGGWLTAQIIKILLSLRQDGLSWQDLITSGGMPSSHVTLVTSMALLIGISEGFYSPLFGIVLTLWGVVVYDSMGVRRATGENTKMLRQIAERLKIGDQKTALVLALGHTPYQVAAGFVWGLIWGFSVYWFFS